MSVELAKPFVDATVNVLTTMASIVPQSGKPFVKKTPEAEGYVTGIVGITSGEKKGSISLSFSKECAMTIVKQMLGEDIEDLLQDMQDAVGEITNMISGQARVGLAELGFDFVGSVPAIIVGEKHSIKHLTQEPVVAVPFTSKAGPFTIEFCFER